MSKILNPKLYCLFASPRLVLQKGQIDKTASTLTDYYGYDYYGTSRYPLEKQDVPPELIESLSDTHTFVDFGKARFSQLRVKLFGENGKNLARKIWHLEELEEKYQDWLDKIEERKTDLKFLIDSYLDILMEDPYLPAELLPDNWIGKKSAKKAYKIFKSLRAKCP